MLTNLAPVDVATILAYFAALFGLGFRHSRREKTSSDYFLAGRQAGWLAIGASLFATSVSTEHIIGLMGSGAIRGLADGQSQLLGCLGILVLGWFIAPLYLKTDVATVPEFIERRFNRTSRVYLTVVSIASYMLTRVSVILFAGGVLLHEILGWDIATSAIAIVMVAGVYAVAGGLKTIMEVDILQSAVLILGAALLTGFGLYEVGGLSGLRTNLPVENFSMFKPMFDPDFPWTAIVFGAPIIGLWYWCTDQYVVQRVLGARSVEDARTGTVFAAALKILSLFIIALPGLIASAALAGNGGLKSSVFPALLAGEFLPVGAKGVVIAGLLAALISSLASCFNSSSTLFTLDLYKHHRPAASDRELVYIGRLATSALVVLGILWVPFIKHISSHAFIYLQSVYACISPPIAAMFVLGLFWRRANGAGAVCALFSGTLLGAARLIAEPMSKAGLITSPVLRQFAEVNSLHFAIGLFLVSSCVLAGVSLLTAAPSNLKFSFLKLDARSDSLRDEKHAPARARMNKVMSGGLVVAVVALWVFLF